MDIKIVLVLLLTCSSALADEYVCESYDKNLPRFSLTSEACRPESLKKQVKEYLLSAYQQMYKKHQYGTPAEAKRDAKKMFKTYKCEWK